MRLQAFTLSLTLSGVAVAFSDATPWMLYSTAPFTAPNANQLQTSSDVLKNTKDILASCPTDHYLFATQPGMKTADLCRNDGADMPSLYLSTTVDKRVQGKYMVSEVVGDITNGNLVNFVKTACSKRGKEVVVEQVQLGQLPQEDRAETLLANDRILSKHIGEGNDSKSFTVLIYAIRSEPAYEAEFDGAIHQDLRRTTRDSRTHLDKDERPLFEKYQFFTPGVFMALITAIVLVSILGVGIRGLASLEVPYAAFEKDMGPAAQKKQQ